MLERADQIPSLSKHKFFWDFERNYIESINPFRKNDVFLFISMNVVYIYLYADLT